MERTSPNQTTFEIRDRKITVERLANGHYKVACKSIGGWKITKTNLRGRNAAWFILRCIQHNTKSKLSKTSKRGKITNLLLDEQMFKMNGVEWITTRMAHGAAPIILKAPKLFRSRLVYIEPIERNRFSLRIVDPLTEHRTRPVEIAKETVENAMKTLGNQQTYDEKENKL